MVKAERVITVQNPAVVIDSKLGSDEKIEYSFKLRLFGLLCKAVDKIVKVRMHSNNRFINIINILFALSV